MTGVDELAHAVAWWLAHPWSAVGVYLVALVMRMCAAGFAGYMGASLARNASAAATLQRQKKEKET